GPGGLRTGDLRHRDHQPEHLSRPARWHPAPRAPDVRATGFEGGLPRGSPRSGYAPADGRRAEGGTDRFLLLHRLARRRTAVGHPLLSESRPCAPLGGGEGRGRAWLLPRRREPRSRAREGGGPLAGDVPRRPGRPVTGRRWRQATPLRARNAP